MTERPTDETAPDLAASLVDAAGRVTRWPRKARDRDAVLRHLAAAFEPGREYAEAEVNAMLDARTLVGDHALLRRELIVHGLLEREPDGSRYRRSA